MLPLINSHILKELELKFQAAGFGTEEELMNKAAFFMSEKIINLIQINKEENRGLPILLLAGSGNNGGDGYRVAWELLQRFPNKDIWVVENQAKSRLCKIKRAELQAMAKVRFCELNEFNFESYNFHFVIDAVFGSGFNPQTACKTWEEIFKKINGSKLEIIAIDLPSGISADEDERLENPIKAKHTLMVCPLKVGPLSSVNRRYLGKVHPVEIGLSKLLPKSDWNLLITRDLRKLLPSPQPINSNKFKRGELLVIAGSESMSGAANLAIESAYRIGAGFVSIITMAPFEQIKSEALKFHFGAKLSSFKRMPNVALIGPGLELNEKTLEILIEYIKGLKAMNVRLIVDASALVPEILKYLDKNDIISPHEGEFQRLYPKSLKGRIRSTLEVAQSVPYTLVRKGFRTLVAQGKDIVTINFGNPSLAKAGTGDVLSGFIAGLMTQGYDSKTAACTGSAFHGYIADQFVKKNKNDFALIASDLFELINLAASTLRAGDRK